MKIYHYLLIVFLLFAMGYITRCSHENAPQTITRTEIDTLTIVDTLRIPTPYTVIDTFFTDADIITIIDSANCVQLAYNYYRTNVYIDTLKNDTTALIVLTDTVNMNKLKHRILDFRYYEKTHYIEPVTSIATWAFYGGVGIVTDKPYLNIGITKDKTNINIGYGKDIYLLNINYKLWSK